MKTFRDLILVDVDGMVLSVACDSAGGIGDKEFDSVKVRPDVLGRFVTRVAVMELLSIGVKPLIISINFCFEPEEAEEAIKGVMKELSILDEVPKLVFSTEKLVKVNQSGMGVTAIGLSHDRPRIGRSVDGDVIVAIGTPCFKDEVIKKIDEIADLNDLLTLLRMPLVHDIIPVGSRGIAHEVEVLAMDSGLEFELIDGELLKKPAGPSTVLLASIDEKDLNEVRMKIKKSMKIVARFRSGSI